jgi:EAL domain-containing protein (putative c-di-GMP-specific phosphodiesterase class I)
VEFVPVLEDCGLICTVGKWVLKKSCEQYVRWQKAGYEPFKLSVNVSPVQFKMLNFTEVLKEVLDETGMNPRYLTLELTESMLIDNLETSTDKLHQLKAMGVSIALDDFGTGYSSLSYLQKFPIDTLKIDRSFVQDVTLSSDKAAIVTAIAALAHSLKLNIVAEGVEDARELAYLSALGCGVIQGFYFSRPLTSDAFEAVLANPDFFQEKMAAKRA